jgi:hypothetical protein
VLFQHCLAVHWSWDSEKKISYYLVLKCTQFTYYITDNDNLARHVLPRYLDTATVVFLTLVCSIRFGTTDNGRTWWGYDRRLYKRSSAVAWQMFGIVVHGKFTALGSPPRVRECIVVWGCCIALSGTRYSGKSHAVTGYHLAQTITADFTSHCNVK